MPDPAVPRIAAVVVTHHPAVEETAELLRRLAPQVGDLVVVDNGSTDDRVARLREVILTLGGTLISLGRNAGIATAQNAGIAWAADHGADAVLLSDQDSLPADDMVERLVVGLRRAQQAASAGHTRPPAAVGPVSTDDRNAGAPLLFSAHRWGPRRATVPDQDGALVEAVFLLASGCLVPMAALESVGPMNDAWFIDHIDLEWGLRAHRAGYTVYGVVGAGMRHTLGDRTQRIPGRARDVHIHSPVRNYYMVRNTVLLIRSDLMPAAWRLGYAAWITKYIAFYMVAVAPRRRRAATMMRGLRDGLLRRTGALEPAGSPSGESVAR